MTSTYSTKSIDHLGLVAAMRKELNIAEQIDKLLPDKRDEKFLSYGQLFVAVILNGLGFTGRTLHMYPEYFVDKPIDRLIGEGIDASNINDDALGVRAELVSQSAYFPNMKSKPAQNPNDTMGIPMLSRC
jgi:hypothetical protein